MHTLLVESKEDAVSQKYPIFIGRGILSRVHHFFSVKHYSNIVIVSDNSVEKTALPKLIKGLNRDNIHTITMKIVEANKNIETVDFLCKQFLKFNVDRSSLIINLGGGVIGDVAGFAASIFKRGVSFIQVPTTLLSQVDSSVGGKVGVNFEGIKNILGAFNVPEAVIVDTETLLTLSDRETLSGFAEVLKHAFICDESYLKLVLEKGSNTIEDVIRKSCELKASIVARDLNEAGLRKILNFGHTFGHAFETLSHKTKNPLTHGEAVSIGMVAEAKLSVLKGLLNEEGLKVIERSLNSFNLPTNLPFDIRFEEVLDLLKSDKKNKAGQIRWSLLERIGKAVIDQSVEMEIVKEGFNYVKVNK